MKNFVEELTWRGMIQDIMPGTEEKLMEGPKAAYVGIDPTADSLHIGHLVSVMILKHFQNCGHKPFALVGGATGMIGDPSMKSAERNLLDEETLNHNVACIKAQLARFLDFDSDAPNKAELVNNYDWMKDYSFINFIRDIGKHITVNYMMAKDSVKKRLQRDSSEGMSFTEFSYQLMQGYRFRPVGQHHHRHRAHPPHRRRRGLRPHLPPHPQGRRHQVRQDREGQHLAGCRAHLPVRVLPVLAERGR